MKQYKSWILIWVVLTCFFPIISVADDSTIIKPPSSFNTYSPSHKVPTTPILNQRYSEPDLVKCPITPVCPDINHPLTNPRDLNCPEQCSVTGEVNPPTGSIIISVKAAVCPKGYLQLSVYNMDKEIVYDPTRSPEIPRSILVQS